MKILKSWGTDGKVVVSLSSSDPGDLEIDEPVFIVFDGLPVPFFIESLEPKGGRFIVKLEDVDTLEEAEEIVGKEAFLEEDENDAGQPSIIGMDIIDAQTGENIGPVIAVDNYSGNVCITVEHKGKEIILPLHEDLVVASDEDTISLTIPSGLI